jgi:hypothetical protein
MTQPDRLALATNERKARWPGWCPACLKPIHTGQRIAKLTAPTGWIHTNCVEIIRAARDRRP